MENGVKLRNEKCEIGIIYNKPVELFCHTEYNRGCPKKRNRFIMGVKCFKSLKEE